MPFRHVILLAAVLCLAAAAGADPINLNDASIVVLRRAPVTDKTVDLLQGEIAKRTGITLPVAKEPSKTGAPSIVLASYSRANGRVSRPPDEYALSGKEEGFAMWFGEGSRGDSIVHLFGQDDLGALFAVGHFLRNAYMAKGTISIDTAAAIATAPELPIRGHQIGYRNTANSYDAWTLADYEQYIRDLIVFGTNAIELIPPESPEFGESPHFKMPAWEMNIALCQLLDAYGLDVWYWLPVDGDVSTPEGAKAELEKRKALFAATPRLDAVFVPGGDPGHTEPAVLMPWLENLVDLLHEYHPRATLWVSNQGFTPEQNDDFFGFLETEQPDWFEGVVFGPWAKISIYETRARTPSRYKVRQYPDICHTVRCQYPVPAWDRAFARTLGREPFNPVPMAITRISDLCAPHSVGSISYSDGITDDVNKMVLTANEWGGPRSLDTILREYGNYFFGPLQAQSVAEGLRAFETNWQGPLRTRGGIEDAHDRWEAIAAAAGETPSPWRLHLCLLRAKYDAYLQRRLIFEAGLEDEAMALLRDATSGTLGPSLDEARAILARADAQPEPVAALRTELIDLGKVLFDEIGLQLDVENYQARNAERGAVLEFLHEPLNDRAWLESEFDVIAALPSDDEKWERLQTVLHWEEPGEGSFYDDLGNASKQPHLFSQRPWRDDPGRVVSAGVEFTRGDGGRLSWLDQAQTLFGTPLRMRYTGLLQGATYRLRVTYAGRFRATMRLVANGEHEVHGPLAQPVPIGPVEFELNPEWTRDGVLDLEWQLIDGRGCQVAEVWLLKQ